MYENETWPKYYLSVVECKSCTISLKFMVAMATRRFLKRYTVGAKSMSPVDVEWFVITYNITIPLCITTQILFLWELSNLNK